MQEKTLKHLKDIAKRRVKAALFSKQNFYEGDWRFSDNYFNALVQSETWQT